MRTHSCSSFTHVNIKISSNCSKCGKRYLCEGTKCSYCGVIISTKKVTCTESKSCTATGCVNGKITTQTNCTVERL